MPVVEVVVLGVPVGVEEELRDARLTVLQLRGGALCLSSLSG